MKDNHTLKKRVIEIAVIVVLSGIIFLACNRNSSDNEIRISTNKERYSSAGLSADNHSESGTGADALIGAGEEADSANALAESADTESEPGTSPNGEADAADIAEMTGGLNPESAKGTDSSLRDQERLFVYVCGAVVNPGLYEFGPDERAMAAVEAAGGFTLDAETDRVNLAEELFDGEMLRIPFLGEEQDSPLLAGSSGNSGGNVNKSGQTGNTEKKSETKEEAGRVNLNTATKAELCTLPGIGEVRAEAILEYREQKGGFTSCEDLMNVPGIKEGTYEKIREHVSLN